MTKLDVDPGPSNALAGIVPAPPEEREPKHWLVFGPTFVVATHAGSGDIARALVLDKLGYRYRPWLADGLSARQAAAAEIKAICYKRRVQPLSVKPQTAGKIGGIARAIRREDVRNTGGRLGEQ